MCIARSALDVISSLVVKYETEETTVYGAGKRLELSLYRNSLIHYFVEQALVAVSLFCYAKVRSGACVDV